MQVGALDVQILSAGRFRLDGGAMFGLVPKLIWQRLKTPDAQNRIELDCRCLLVRSEAGLLLVETGCGDKFEVRERQTLGLAADPGITAALHRAGVAPEQVRWVFLTHLHFDHAGGATRYGARGQPVPAFPNATYLIHQGEWQDAQTNFGVMKTSYRTENFQPLEDSGQLRLLSGDEAEILPGIQALRTGGHTRHHLSVLVQSNGRALWFPGDLVPTRHHLRGPYLMAYDLYPYETMQQKLHLLARAEAGHWTVVWPHETSWSAGRVYRDQRGDWAAEEICVT